MGFYSWLADGATPINNRHSAAPHERPVYMLSTYGDHIREDSYEGHGEFGGVDAFVHLAKMNLGITANQYADEQLRSLGVFMDCGVVYRDPETGQLYGSSLHVPAGGEFLFGHPGIEQAFGRYDEPIQFGKFAGRSANELRESGAWEAVRVSSVVKYPLKFSFHADADYELEPAAESDPNQGFFFDPEEDENNSFVIEEEE